TRERELAETCKPPLEVFRGRPLDLDDLARRRQIRSLSGPSCPEVDSSGPRFVLDVDGVALRISIRDGSAYLDVAVLRILSKLFDAQCCTGRRQSVCGGIAA